MKPAKRAAVVLATALAALVLWKLRIALGYLAASLAIAAAVHLVADRLRPAMPRWLGVAVAYVLGVALSAALVFLIGRAVFVEAPRSANHYAAAYERLQAHREHGLLRFVIAGLPPPAELYREIGDGSLAPGALRLTRALLDGVILAVIALVLSVYWAGRRIHLERLVGAVIGPERRDRLFGYWRAVALVAGAHFRHALLECSLSALSIAFGLHMFGVRPAASPAVVAAMALLVPFFGPLLAVAVVVLSGLATSPAAACVGGLVALTTIVFVRTVVAPRLAPVPSIDPLLLLGTMLVLSSAIGLAGVALAGVTATVIAIAARRILARRVAARAPRLDAQVYAARVHLLHGADAAVPDEHRALVERLHLLVDEGEGWLQRQPSPPER